MKTSNNSKTNTNSKAKIDTYRCDIYSFSLVVANQYITLEELRNKYSYCDGEELTDDVIAGEASTSRCIDKETNETIILVKFNHHTQVKGVDKTLNFINTVSHEASHVAIDVYAMCDQNICFCSPEPFCYLQGWACECIYKTLKK